MLYFLRCSREAINCTCHNSLKSPMEAFLGQGWIFYDHNQQMCNYSVRYYVIVSIQCFIRPQLFPFTINFYRNRNEMNFLVMVCNLKLCQNKTFLLNFCWQLQSFLFCVWQNRKGFYSIVGYLMKSKGKFSTSSFSKLVLEF